MDAGYPDPEIWPDDDVDLEPKSKDELAREVLDGEELRDYFRDKRRKAGRW